MADAGTERQRVRALIERAGVAMLMNVDEKGTHIGRPMLPLLVQNDPHIYFLTHQQLAQGGAARAAATGRIVVHQLQLLSRCRGFRPALARS